MNEPDSSSGDLDPKAAAARARWIRAQLPKEGLFAGQDWRIASEPFALDLGTVKILESLGRVLLQFYRAANRLYRLSLEGRQPAWIAELLDQGKPESLLAWQRAHAFKNDLPRVIRPDVLLTDSGLGLVELDSVPGGIGLTAWLNRVYSQVPGDHAPFQVIGGADGMLQGFSGIFGQAKRVHIVVSEESATYRPEMTWLAQQLGPDRFQVHDAAFAQTQPGDAVYRFFELFDLAHVPGAEPLFRQAHDHQIQLTPPPKPLFEEKLWFALLWNRNLREFWHRELGAGFFQRLLGMVPYSWVVDPTPLPPHAAYPELDLTDWRQLTQLSQKQRDLILKISGFSDKAWGARGVYLGSDLSHEDWSAAVEHVLRSWPRSPFVLMRYHKPRAIETRYHHPETDRVEPMTARARLCPYYFVHGEGDAARPHLGGVLATLCPADKKIIHGMKEAVLAPCSVGESMPGPA